MARKLVVTFAGHRVSDEGVPVDGLVAALSGVQDALKLMVGHLGGHQHGQGQPPRWVRQQSRLALRTTRTGSLIAELELVPPLHGEGQAAELGLRALDALLGWDGIADSTLPVMVIQRLNQIPRSLPTDMELWLGDDEVSRRVKVGRSDLSAKRNTGEEIALLYGWLSAVNWDRHTAQLRVYGNRNVSLRFSPALHDQMLDCATQFVEVRGRGRFNNRDQWQYVQVERLRKSNQEGQPFDLEAFLSNPNPKIFDPDTVTRASEPFDVDEFIQFIKSSREDRNT